MGEICQCQVVCCISRQAWGIYHPPTFPTCLPCGKKRKKKKMCRCKKKKKKINFKNCPTFVPCRSLPKEKNPRKKLADLPKIHLKKNNNDNLHVFFFFIAELPDIPGPGEISAKRQEKRSFENASSSYDPSASLFSTLDAESSAVLHLNPPKKRTKLSDITFSSGEEDEVLGNIHPSNKSKTTFLVEENTNFDPGSPLDRSTPISEYESEEAEAFSMTEKTENISPKKITLSLHNQQL